MNSMLFFWFFRILSFFFSFLINIVKQNKFCVWCRKFFRSDDSSNRSPWSDTPQTWNIENKLRKIKLLFLFYNMIYFIYFFFEFELMIYKRYLGFWIGSDPFSSSFIIFFQYFFIRIFLKKRILRKFHANVANNLLPEFSSYSMRLTKKVKSLQISDDRNPLNGMISAEKEKRSNPKTS